VKDFRTPTPFRGYKGYVTLSLSKGSLTPSRSGVHPYNTQPMPSGRAGGSHFLPDIPAMELQCAMHLQGDRLSSKRFSLFESPGGGHFRYPPMTDTMLNTLVRNDRLVQLWQGLLADPVAPDPAAWQGRTGESRFGMNDGVALPLAPDRDPPSLSSLEPVPFTGTVKTGLPSRARPRNVVPQPGGSGGCRSC